MASLDTLPRLLTVGEMARRLGVRPYRVAYILATREHIEPTALAGMARLYDLAALARVRHELNAIDARRCTREGRPQ